VAEGEGQCAFKLRAPMVMVPWLVASLKSFYNNRGTAVKKKNGRVL
jgi:hypothetical protein